jgi:hypothetical protein
MKLSFKNGGAVLDDYIATALWSSSDDNGEALDKHYSIDDLDPGTLSYLKSDLFDFITTHQHLINADDSDRTLGYFAHNYWLTRNGHGAGFWDAGYANGDELTEHASARGERYLFIDRANKIRVD